MRVFRVLLELAKTKRGALVDPALAYELVYLQESQIFPKLYAKKSRLSSLLAKASKTWLQLWSGVPFAKPKPRF